MKILAVSDQIVERIYTLASNGHFSDAQLVVGCGDLPYPYLEYLVTVLNVPLFYVPGNHDPEFNQRFASARAEGCTNLDLRFARARGLTLAGFGGSIRYRPDGLNQYTQSEATVRALGLLPRLLWHRLRFGRGVDILIAHSPPFGIHDSDRAHVGLKALNLLIRLGRPRYLLHGHTHFYRQNLESSITHVLDTTVMNIFPYKVIEIETDDTKK